MTTTTAAHPANADEDLAFTGAATLSEMLGAGQATPRELAEFFLARIEQLNPKLRAFTSTRADAALAEADAALGRLRAGERGPLLGVPIAIKDNVDLAGEPTRHGACGEPAPATADSAVVQRLRGAGAVILGRTALCELAAYGHFTSSEANGVTRNPWNLERSPGGSSGGSAAAVAAGMVPVALGSDGGGSIRIPAAFCGLFGLKPQRGRVPLDPLDDHWYGCTVLGGIGRSVLDVAVFDDVIGSDAEHTLAAAAVRQPGQLRIAVSVKPPIPGVKTAPESLAAVEETAELLRSLGHSVETRELAHPQLITTFTPRWAAGIRDDATARGGEGLSSRTRHMARLGGWIGGRPLRRSLARERVAAERLNAVFGEYDLVMTPVTAAPPPSAEISTGAGAFRTFNQGSPYVCYTPTWNYVGQPAASVPAGFDPDGLPRAVQLAGPANSEATIVALAAQIESVTHWPRRRPAAVTSSN